MMREPRFIEALFSDVETGALIELTETESDRLIDLTLPETEFEADELSVIAFMMAERSRFITPVVASC